MPNLPISQLGPAGPLAGTEPVPIVQNGVTVQTSTQDIADLALAAPQATDTLLANYSGGTGPPTPTAITAALDSLGAAQGDVLYRGSSSWAALAAGAAGTVLTSQGTGIDPEWSPSIPGSFQSVANLTALRALTTADPAFVFLEAWGAAAGLGGGFFWYNAADTTSADNGGTIIVPNGTLTGRWYRIFTETGFMYVEWFGAVGGNSSVDDSPGIVNCTAANAARGGGVISTTQGPGTVFYSSVDLDFDPAVHTLVNFTHDNSLQTFTNPASEPNLLSDPAFATGSPWTSTSNQTVANTYGGSGLEFNLAPNTTYEYLETGQQIICAAGTKLTLTVTIGQIVTQTVGANTYRSVLFTLRANIGGGAANSIANGGNVGTFGTASNTDSKYAPGAVYVFNVIAGGANPYLRIQSNAGVQLTYIVDQAIPDNAIHSLTTLTTNTRGNTWHEHRNVKIQTAETGATQNYVIGFNFDCDVSGGVSSANSRLYNCDASTGIGIAAQFNNNAYLMDFYGCRFIGSLYSVNTISGSIDAGENINWFGGNVGGSEIAFNNSGGFSLNLHGTSCDFAGQAYVGGDGFQTFGAWFELGAATDPTLPYVYLQSGTQRHFGGLFQIDGSTTPVLPFAFVVGQGAHLWLHDMEVYNLQGTTGAIVGGSTAGIINTTGSASSGNVVTVGSTAGIIVGWICEGPNVPVNTTVSSIGSGTVTLSNNITAALPAGATYNFYALGGRVAAKMLGGPNKNISPILKADVNHNDLGIAGQFADSTIGFLAWTTGGSNQINQYTVGFNGTGSFTADVLQGSPILQNLSVDLTSTYSQAQITNNTVGTFTDPATVISNYQNTGFTFTANTTLGNQTISSMSTAPTASNAYNKYISGAGIVQGSQIVAYNNGASSATIQPSPSATATGATITTDKIAILNKPWLGPTGAATTIDYLLSSTAQAGMEITQNAPLVGPNCLTLFKTGVGSGTEVNWWLAFPVDADRAIGGRLYFEIPANGALSGSADLYFNWYFAAISKQSGWVVPTVGSMLQAISNEVAVINWNTGQAYSEYSWDTNHVIDFTGAPTAHDGYAPKWATHVLCQINGVSAPNGAVINISNLFSNRM